MVKICRYLIICGLRKEQCRWVGGWDGWDGMGGVNILVSLHQMHVAYFLVSLGISKMRQRCDTHCRYMFFIN